MFRLIAIVAFATLCSRAPAHAEISADLKFCADLKSGKERLACYDAAARIEKTVQSQTIKRAPPSVAIAQLPNPPQVAASPTKKFEGFYLGITGGYQMATKAQDDIGSFYPLPGSERGWKVGGVAGFGKEAGPLYFGFEARGQYSFVKSQLTRTGSYTSPYTFPYVQQSTTCYGCDQSYFDTFPLPSSDPLYVSSSYDYLARRTQDWQFDLTFRPGIIVSDWLLYAKMGVGVEQTTDSTTNSIATTSCTPVYERQRPGPQTVQVVAVSCGNSVTAHNQIDWLLRTISPVGILGVGIERSFGPLFVRAESEITLHYYQQYSPSFNLVTGYRF